MFRRNHHRILIALATSCLLVVPVTLRAQFIEVADTALQRVLCEKHPNAMVNGCTQIDSAEAWRINPNFNLDEQNISDISPLLELDHIVWLEADGNLITSVGSFEKMTSLEELDLSFNPMVTLPDFSTLNSPTFRLLKLERLDTFLDEFPDLSSVANTIEQVQVQRNGLTSIADTNLPNYPLLTQVALQWNRLTFSDMLFLSADPDFDTKYTLFPQKRLALEISQNDPLHPGNTVTLTIDIEQPDSDNDYMWYKGVTYITNTNEPALTLHDVQPDDAGDYHALIRNTSGFFNKLSDTLTTLSKTVEVETDGLDCTPIAEATINVTARCRDHEITLTGLNPDTLSWILTPELGTDSIVGAPNLFSDLENGTYHLTVRSNAGCYVELTELVSINNQEDCNEVISPNGDGIGDVYFVPDSGEVKIIDQRGQVLREFSGPGFWDGSDNSGSLMNAGYYLILVNDEKKSNITLER